MASIPPISSTPISSGASNRGDLLALRALSADIAAVEAATVDSTNPQPDPPSAVTSAVRAAASNQGGLAALFSDLSAALQSPHTPAVVQAAIGKVLGFQLPLDPPPTAAELKQAFAQSGLFLEFQLATTGSTPDSDLKAALLSLFQALETWAGAGVERPPTTGPAPPPPLRGGPMKGQPAARAALPADAPPAAVAGRLIKDTSGAISRQVLMQAASAGQIDRAHQDSKSAQWLFEVPLATPQGAAIAQFEIDRDGAASDGPEDQRVWRARFSLDVDPMGPIHAEISLTGGAARVSLWAAKPETMMRLNEQQGDLADALRADDLDPHVAIFPGAPAVAPQPVGQLADRAI